MNILENKKAVLKIWFFMIALTVIIGFVHFVISPININYLMVLGFLNFSISTLVMIVYMKDNKQKS
ncbi:hypothetical protein [Oceanobacillus iheyensis]|uniref:hypothetical protein n=1 Tax=Oceanobacillus iheyensis TaxID=182710 RepID=UPI0005A2424B|nr:hypothetical protein [Oceanobacillus iheyensis]